MNYIFKSKWGKRGLKVIVLFLIFIIPIIPYSLTWVTGEENLLFDTPSGDLEKGYYYTQEGEIFVRVQPSDRAGWISVGEKYDTTGLLEAHVIGKAYYNTFTDGKRNYRERTTEKEYKDAAFIKNHPQPEKNIFVSLQRILRSQIAGASIAFNATTTSGDQVTSSSYSFSHTVSGDKPLIVALFQARGNPVTVTTITYNGTPLIMATTTTNGTRRTALLYKEAPATGSNTMAVTLGGTPLGSNVTALSLNGVDQSTPLDAIGGALGNSTAPSATVTVVNNNSWVVDSMTIAATNCVVGAGQTKRSQVNVSTNTGYTSTEGPKNAGSVVMDWSSCTTTTWATVAASFKESPDTFIYLLNNNFQMIINNVKVILR